MVQSAVDEYLTSQLRRRVNSLANAFYSRTYYGNSIIMVGVVNRPLL